MTGGALVIGADYRALGVVRSLGRRRVPVWVLRRGDDRLAGLSRYARRTVELRDGAGFLLELGREHRLDGWTLFPSSDETAALVARHHAELAARFRLTTPPWEVTRYAYDKRLTYPLAAEIGLDVPQTWYPRDRDEVALLPCAFPVVIKPAVKARFNRLTAAKAWRADDRAGLVARYDAACALVEPEVLIVQELIPGGGGQLSYAAICEHGRPLGALTARRLRQYPMDFGRASTFVETAHLPEAAEPARALLARLGYTGLVEVEFKLDPRDGRCKLLDVNPRVWGWHTLCGRAGIDFAWLAWLQARGEPVEAGTARAGVRWTRLTTDLPTAAAEIRKGRLRPRDYLRSLRGPRERAIFARDDPLPGLAEVPLLVALLLRRLARRSGV
ncbi:MAG TPA: ATP-grasp domain-containing protein [Gaiellaceae bacterium]|nr:ATP-grasp domain-containing protein [Gaiellaceae bacterium]